VATGSSVFIVSSGCHKLAKWVILGGFERNQKWLSETAGTPVIIYYFNSFLNHKPVSSKHFFLQFCLQKKIQREVNTLKKAKPEKKIGILQE